MQNLIIIALLLIAVVASNAYAHGNHGAEYACVRQGREVKIKRKSAGEKRIVCQEAGGEWVLRDHEHHPHDHDVDKQAKGTAAQASHQ